MRKKFLVVLILFFSVSVASTEVTDICMSPLGECHKVVMKQIREAQETLDLALYSLTLDVVAHEILKAHQRDVKVRLIIDNVQEALKSADDDMLEEAGIEVIRRRGLKGALMHHKFAIVDSTAVLTGSYNWTKNGTFKNSENLLVIYDPYVVKEFQKEFDLLWSLGPYKRRSHK